MSITLPREIAGTAHNLTQLPLPTVRVHAVGPDPARLHKLNRILWGAKPRVLDLFSGCGGLSLGFKIAGFEISGAVEIDPIAAASHAENFHRSTQQERQLHAQPRDVTQVEPEQLVKELDLGSNPDRVIDVVLGGPPCQAYARVGRAKLREVAAHPKAFKQDERGNLYLRYLHYVRVLKPLVILVENVPDVINYGGHNIPQEMCDVLADLGYTCKYTLLNAAFYGVPQMRERMFLLAYAPELNRETGFPAPINWVDLPAGYEGSRQVALKALTPTLFNGNAKGSFVQPVEPARSLPFAVTAQDALDDLPRIDLHLEGKLKRGARRFTEMQPYPNNTPVSAYAYHMRAWPSYESQDGIHDHVIRSLPRDYAIFERMLPGDQYPEAHQHALQLFEERLHALAREGNAPGPGSVVYNKLRAETVPPYDTGKFPNKWRKMEADRPARTLMAHLGKDGYSHIHYDSSQARTISVREAARLQSFPDGFVFCGTMNPAFRQIGNAVPPLLAYSIAEKVLEDMRGE